MDIHCIACVSLCVGYCQVTVPLTSKRVSNIPKYGSGANACIYCCLRTQDTGGGVVGVAPRAQYGWHQAVAVQLIFQKGGTHRQIGYLLYILQGF